MKPPLTAIFFFLTLPAWAQIGGGSIIGVITDASGANVPGVQVTALNMATNESWSAIPISAFTGATTSRGTRISPKYRAQQSLQFQRLGSAIENLTGDAKINAIIKISLVCHAPAVTKAEDLPRRKWCCSEGSESQEPVSLKSSEA
jgi:hypothetical protein